MHGGPHILVVEDEPIVGAYVARLLQRRGYRVTTVGSASEALDALERTAGDVRLMLADTRLPGMSGAELIDEARRRWPQLRIVRLSGANEPPPGSEPYGESLGTVPFLEKPFEPGDLFRVVESALGGAPGGAAAD
ncbi:MAG TPA: response regulator [Gemmatimonadales bacterium]|nr:response regulator [Gemmatimonadales bacterium]